jgi:hypothetical protein
MHIQHVSIKRMHYLNGELNRILALTVMWPAKHSTTAA